MSKRFFAHIHKYVLWALLSAVFWAWIFTFLTDAPSSQKIVIYSDTQSMNERALAEELEKDKPSNIRMIQIYPFSYALVDVTAPERADMYVLSETDLVNRADLLFPIPLKEEGYIKDGVLLGLLLFDKEDGAVAAAEFFQYAGDMPGIENYYLCFSKTSSHLGEWNESQDDAAIQIAETILQLP